MEGTFQPSISKNPPQHAFATVTQASTRAVDHAELQDMDLFPAPSAPALRDLRVLLQSGETALLRGQELVTRVAHLFEGLRGIDAAGLVRQTLRGLYDGAAEVEVQKLLITNAANSVTEDPAWSLAAARLLDQVIVAEVLEQNIRTFGDCIRISAELGLIAPSVAAFVAEHAAELDAALVPTRGRLFGYFGLQTVYDRYLLRHPTTRKVVEMPQYFFMRVAVGARTPSSGSTLSVMRAPLGVPVGSRKRA